MDVERGQFGIIYKGMTSILKFGHIDCNTCEFRESIDAEFIK